MSRSSKILLTNEARFSPPPGEPGIAGLEQTLTPYLKLEGVEAAGLVSIDGLPVAWAGARMKPEVIAAHAASVFSSLNALASVLGDRFYRAINLGLPGRDLILAPMTEDLLLVIVGRADVIKSLVQGSASSPWGTS